MKAVMTEVPQFILDWRRKTGEDRRDEMWEGVLHMVPSPTLDHQDFEWALETWLRMFWAERCKANVYHQINVAEPGTWPNNYRIPDLILVLPDRFDLRHETHFEGAPTVVAEIRSPNDETYAKLPFYAKIGVPEVWVFDRDTKAPEIYTLAEDGYEAVEADEAGWHRSAVADVQMRGTENHLLELQVVGDEATRRQIPKQPISS